MVLSPPMTSPMIPEEGTEGTEEGYGFGQREGEVDDDDGITEDEDMGDDYADTVANFIPPTPTGTGELGFSESAGHGGGTSTTTVGKVEMEMEMKMKRKRDLKLGVWKGYLKLSDVRLLSYLSHASSPLSKPH